MSLWTEPKYPGDAVRILRLKRGGELGDVRIQQYDTFFRAASFLPGVRESSPGDTRPGAKGPPGKTWPEKSEICHFTFSADEAFDRLVAEAYEGGWQNYNPEPEGDEVTIDWSTGGRVDNG